MIETVASCSSLTPDDKIPSTLSVFLGCNIFLTANAADIYRSGSCTVNTPYSEIDVSDIES